MNKKGNPSKNRIKRPGYKTNKPALFQRTFKIDVLKKYGVQGLASFVLKDIFTWAEHNSMKTWDYEAEFKLEYCLTYFWYSLKNNADSLMINVQTLRRILDGLATSQNGNQPVLFLETIANKKALRNEKGCNQKYGGKNLYFAFNPKVLEEMLSDELKEQAARFLDEIYLKTFNYEAEIKKIDVFHKQREKILIESKMTVEEKKDRVKNDKKVVLDKLNNKDSIQVKISKPKTEGEKKMDIQEILKKDFKDLTDAEKILLMDTPLPDEEKEINGMEYSNIYDDPNYGIPECYRD